MLEKYLTAKILRAPGISFTAQLRSSEQHPEKAVLQPERAPGLSNISHCAAVDIGTHHTDNPRIS
jgi:hypothetical protein